MREQRIARGSQPLFQSSVLGALVVASGICASVPASARSVYVAPNGNQDGSSEDAPTQLKVAASMTDPSIETVVLLPGVYRLESAITINRSGQTWRGAVPLAAVLDGGGQADTALVVKGSHNTITGLVIRAFTKNGIVLDRAYGTKIIGNRITDITSSAWSQGGIHGLIIAPNTLVQGNYIARTGYGGIVFDTNPNGDLSNVTINGNTIADTCRIKADCGAIYVNGRSPRTSGVRITNNIVQDFGPEQNQTKGIYLDDLLSGAVVTGNHINGSGTYAFQIHGGSNNRITGNVVSVPGKFMLYQDNKMSAGSAMKGNVVSGNDTNTTATTKIGSPSGDLDLIGEASSRPRS